MCWVPIMEITIVIINLEVKSWQLFFFFLKCLSHSSFPVSLVTVLGQDL